MKYTLYKTVKHFFPEFRKWLKETKDPRNENSMDYPAKVMIWLGILMFMLKLPSRRQINFEFNSEEFRKNLSMLSKEKLEKIPHDTTLAYYAEGVAPEEISKIRTKIIYRLIRMKALKGFKLGSCYRIAIDGSGHLSFSKRHCEHCLKVERVIGAGDTKRKVEYYYHPVLEAKLISSNGMALSIGTEFIENPDQYADKQDCELKAFYRLEKKIKEQFPQLKICLLLDGLYANQNVFNICRTNNWNYMITFKEGSMPATYSEYKTLKKLNKDCSGKYKNNQVKQNYRWVNEIEYEGHFLNVLECAETKLKEQTKKTFVWLTNYDISEYNYHILANEGGRLRWKIENEGFNIQKNGGYNLKHAYSLDETGMKNFYLFMQIAHILNQLIEKGSLLGNNIKKTFGSIRNISRRLLESLRTTVFDSDEINFIESSKFQIRLRAP